MPPSYTTTRPQRRAPGTPATPAIIRALTGHRVRMVVTSNSALDKNRVLVGDLICYVKRVDGKGTGEAILIDDQSKGYAVSLRRIQAIYLFGDAAPMWSLTREAGAADDAAQLATLGRHLAELCARCGELLPDGRPHLSANACAEAAPPAGQ